MLFAQCAQNAYKLSARASGWRCLYPRRHPRRTLRLSDAVCAAAACISMYADPPRHHRERSAPHCPRQIHEARSRGICPGRHRHSSIAKLAFPDSTHVRGCCKSFAWERRRARQKGGTCVRSPALLASATQRTRKTVRPVYVRFAPDAGIRIELDASLKSAWWRPRPEEMGVSLHAMWPTS